MTRDNGGVSRGAPDILKSTFLAAKAAGQSITVFISSSCLEWTGRFNKRQYPSIIGESSWDNDLSPIQYENLAK